MKNKLGAAVILLGLGLGAGLAAAHEFWLDPVDFAPKVGARVPIVQRNGQDFLGDSYPYERKWAKRFSVHDARGERPIKAVEGDDPAAEVHVPNAGLAVVVFQRVPDLVVYQSVAHLIESLEDEGLDDLAVRYRALSPAPRRISERYTRYAKTLLNVGPGDGDDRPVGLAFEIIVETNPYTANAGTPIAARVLKDGRPVAGVQVKAFNRADPQSPRRLRTDADGRVTFAGLLPGETMLSAATMMDGDPAARDAKSRSDLVSLWASVTFRR